MINVFAESKLSHFYKNVQALLTVYASSGSAKKIKYSQIFAAFFNEVSSTSWMDWCPKKRQTYGAKRNVQVSPAARAEHNFETHWNTFIATVFQYNTK